MICIQYVHCTMCRVVMANNHQIGTDNLAAMVSNLRQHKAMVNHQAISRLEVAMVRLLHRVMVPLANNLVCAD